MGHSIFQPASLLAVFLLALASPAAEPDAAPPAAAKALRPDLQGIAMITPEAALNEVGTPVGELVTERYPDGRPKIERRVIQDSAGNYVNHGPYTYYDPQRKVARSGQFRNGSQHGRWLHRFTDDRGYLFSRLNEKTFTGPFLSEANFVDGQLHGPWTIKDAKGQSIVEWNFDHDVATGKWTWFYPNAQKRLEASYRDGVLNGDMKEWDRDGKLMVDRTYVGGKWLDKVIGWHAPGRKAYEGYYLRVGTIPEPKYNWWTASTSPGAAPEGEDERHAQWISWYPNGNKKAEWTYDHDLMVGQITWWYENGQRWAEGSYDAGEKAGTWITWHSNGLKESEGEYRAGQLVGQWAHWDANGRLLELRDAKPGGATAPGVDGALSQTRVDASAGWRPNRSTPVR